MACLTPLSVADARRLGAEYGLEISAVTPLEAGSVNSNFLLIQSSGQPVFARIYEEQEREGAEAEIQLLAELAALGVKTPAPVPRVDGTLVGRHAGKPFSMYPWVAGEWLCHERLTEAHCEALGRALAQVHLTTPQLTHVPDGRFGMNDMRQRLERVMAERPTLAEAVQRIEQGLQRYERERPTVAMGLIHGDLFRDNVLWKINDSGTKPELAALLDFESACFGSFIYDLMVCVLSWCFTNELQKPRAKAMIRGYTSIRPLAADEQQGAAVEGKLACLRFATTRLTDFELRTPIGQTAKRDYRRFLLRYDALEDGAMDAVWRS